MANFGLLLLTTKGINEQYKAQSGSPLKFKRIGMGSGTLSVNAMTLTKLVKEEVSVHISKGYMQNDSYVVEGFFSNEGLNTGFAWREIGLFVEDENGKEILYSYANAGDSYDYIPATADERYSKYIRIATAIGNATNISIVESEGFVTVDVRTFNAAVEEFRTDISALWPSRIASGKTLAFGDSANLPLIGLRIHGKSEQNKTTGKQLLHNTLASYSAYGITFTTNDDGSVSISGTATGEAYYLLDNANAIPLVNTELIASISGNPDVSMTVGYYTSNTDFVNEVVAVYGSAEKTFSYPSEAIATRTFLTVSTGKTVNATVYPMIRLASITDNTYEAYTGGSPSPSPDFPQDLSCLGAEGEIELTVAGKNLIPFPYQTTASGESGLTWNIGSDGGVTISGTSTGGANFYFVEHLKLPKGRYRIHRIGSLVNGGLMIYNGVNVLAEVSKNGTYGEFEITKDDEEILVYLNIHTAGISLSGTVYPMLTSVENDNFEYELYKGSRNMSVSTPNGLNGIPVSSGGNYTDENGQQWICDEVDLERGVYVKRTNTADLGELEWYYNEPYAVFTAPVQDLNPDTLVMLCTHYLTSTMNSASSPDLTIYGRKDSYGIGGLGVKNSNYTDATTFKAAMAGAIVLYELKEPIETPLTDEEIAAFKALTAYNPSTTILNDAGAEVTAEYVTKTFDGVVGMLIKRIADLETTLGNINAILESINGGE